MTKVKFRRLENGFGNISKLSGKRRNPYRARKTIGYNQKGYQIYSTVGYYPNYTAAFQALVEYNQNPYDLTQKDLSLKEFMDMWYKVQENKVSVSTLTGYRTVINKLQPLGYKLFKDIDTETIQQLVNEEKTVSNKKNMKKIFGLLYKFAREKDIFKKDFSEFVHIKEVETTKEKTPFTNEEIKLCYTKLKDDEFYSIAFVLLCTGLRPSELLELKKENIHFDKNYMIAGGKTKAGTNRKIPLSKFVIPILEGWIAEKKPHLISNYQGNKVTYAYASRRCRRFLENHTLHECRHTFISNMARINCNMTTVKKIVGHTTTDVTEAVYTHKTHEELQDAIKQFDEYMSKILCF